jgi:hypothetical protein
MSEQGVVKERSQTEGGAKYITIGRQRYYFDRDVESLPEVGAKIDFEWHEFGEARGRFGKPRSISKWSPVTNGATGKPETGSTITDADILRSVSNVVGSACAAGTVKSPEDLEKWFVAAWAGFTRRQKSATGADPEFNDDLPDSFYEGLPPQRSRSNGGPGF